MAVAGNYVAAGNLVTRHIEKQRTAGDERNSNELLC
jgi:hypothetical protein